jgi:hypothetical protein
MVELNKVHMKKAEIEKKGREAQVGAETGL